MAAPTRDCRDGPARSTSRRRHCAHSSITQTQWQWCGLVANITLLSDSWETRVEQITSRATVLINNSTGGGEQENMSAPTSGDWTNRPFLTWSPEAGCWHDVCTQCSLGSAPLARLYLCAQNGDARIRLRSGAHWACAVTSARTHRRGKARLAPPWALLSMRSDLTRERTHTGCGLCLPKNLACLHHNKQGICNAADTSLWIRNKQRRRGREDREQGPQRRGGGAPTTPRANNKDRCHRNKWQSVNNNQKGSPTELHNISSPLDNQSSSPHNFSIKINS